MFSEASGVNGAGASSGGVGGYPARRRLRRLKCRQASTAKMRMPPHTPASAPVGLEGLCTTSAVGEAGASDDGEGVGGGEVTAEVTAVVDVCVPELVP